MPNHCQNRASKPGSLAIITALSLMAAALMAAALLAFLGWQAMLASIGPATLPEPGPRVAVSPDNIDIVIATAHHGRLPNTIHRIVVEFADAKRFKEHLFNIAHQQGWYAHVPDNRGLSLVLPKQDLHRLDDMAQDPAAWTLRNIDPSAPAIGPSSTDLAHVELDIAFPPNYLQYRIIAVVLWVAAAVAIAVPLACCSSAFDNWLDARK